MKTANFEQISAEMADISDAAAEDDCRKGRGSPGLRRQQMPNRQQRCEPTRLRLISFQ